MSYLFLEITLCLQNIFVSKFKIHQFSLFFIWLLFIYQQVSNSLTVNLNLFIFSSIIFFVNFYYPIICSNCSFQIFTLNFIVTNTYFILSNNWWQVIEHIIKMGVRYGRSIHLMTSSQKITVSIRISLSFKKNSCHKTYHNVFAI